MHQIFKKTDCKTNLAFYSQFGRMLWVGRKTRPIATIWVAWDPVLVSSFLKSIKMPLSSFHVLGEKEAWHKAKKACLWWSWSASVKLVAFKLSHSHYSNAWSKLERGFEIAMFLGIFLQRFWWSLKEAEHNNHCVKIFEGSVSTRWLQVCLVWK